MQKSECHGGTQLRNRKAGTEHHFLHEAVNFVNRHIVIQVDKSELYLFHLFFC